MSVVEWMMAIALVLAALLCLLVVVPLVWGWFCASIEPMFSAASAVTIEQAEQPLGDRLLPEELKQQMAACWECPREAYCATHANSIVRHCPYGEVA